MKRNSEYLYEFDTFGYCIIPGLISQKQIDEISKTLDLIKENNYYLENTDVVLGKMREDGTAFISNIASASELLSQLAFNDRVLSVLHLVMGESFCFNHSNSIVSCSGSTYPHMAGVPIHSKAFYHTRGNQVLSSLTKLVVPIANNTMEAGGFAVIKGSHKANFAIPYAKRSEEEYSLLEYIKINPGDGLLFTEALTHGSLVNTSKEERKMIYYCYGLDYMPEWPTQGLKISERFKRNTPDEYKKYLS